MTDYPIIFSAPMVRALLDGRKTMTRRLRYNKAGKLTPWAAIGMVGARLWVRESGILSMVMTDSGWCDCFRHDVPETPKLGRWWIENRRGPGASYSPEACTRQAALADAGAKIRPSIHMPRWASRLTLEVTATKMERLQDISEEDAKAEGIVWQDNGSWTCDPGNGPASNTPAHAFAALWQKLHGPESWDSNPEVVALTFTVHATNIDQMKEAA